MKQYTQHFNTKTTPQTQPIPGENQVANRAGGYGWALDKWGQLNRFLIIGTEGGTFYAGEHEMTVENAKNTIACIKEDGLRAVKAIVEVSDLAKAPKNDPAIFALALACTYGDAATKSAAYSSITKVCRIGTHIFQFCEAVEAMRGWSGGLRNGVAKFYETRKPASLANQVIKYQQRGGWSHRDVLRLSHASSKDATVNGILRYAVGKDVEAAVLHPLIAAYESIKNEKDEKKVIKAIQEHGLPRECVPTEHLNSKKVWEALLEKMPLIAMMRNLGKMSAIGLLDSNLSSATKKVTAMLESVEELKSSRVHPIQLLVAHKIYGQGAGDKGSLTWKPVGNVVSALETAFYASFGLVTPTGKNFLLGLDVSGSMGGGQAGKTPLRPCEVTAAMSMLTVRTEKNHEIMGFCDRFVDLGINDKMSLEEVVNRVVKSNFGSTDVAKAVEYATTKKLPIDVFAIYTDCETYSGTQHVVQALKKHREKTGINSKVVFVATTATNFTLADPNDPGMLDIPGFSTDVPHVISEFARGNF